MDPDYSEVAWTGFTAHCLAWGLLFLFFDRIFDCAERLGDKWQYWFCDRFDSYDRPSYVPGLTLLDRIQARFRRRHQ